jgi:hypothetical protein
VAAARVDGDAGAGALDRRTVGRAEIAEDVAVALAEDLGVLSRQVVVGEHDGVGRTATQRDHRRVELEARPGGGSAEDFEDNVAMFAG